MSHTPAISPPIPPEGAIPLVHRPGRIFETLGFDEHWAQGGYEDGHKVDDESTSSEAMLVEFSFVLPRLSSAEPGKYPILSVARDRTEKGPDGRLPDGPEVYLHFCYEPAEDRFLVGANVGTRSSDLQVFALGGAPAAGYTRRVLSGTFVISRNGIFPSIDDPFTGQQELFGDIALSPRGDQGGETLSNRYPRHPWGGPPRGTWRIRSGAESDHDEEERSFPGGFGLSDLRITLLGDSDHGLESLPYSGALDHLASADWHEVNPFGPDDWEFGDDLPMSEVLLGLADQLHDLSGDASTWASRARGLAEETQQLARGFPEDPDLYIQEETETYDF